LKTATAQEPVLISETERRRLIGSMENRLHIRARLAGREPAEVTAEFAAGWELCLRCGGWRRRKPAS
jgi:hypothetical protein